MMKLRSPAAATIEHPKNVGRRRWHWVPWQAVSRRREAAPFVQRGRTQLNGPLEGKTILLVDDDPDILTAMTTLMEDTGATVETAVDGNAAIKRAREVDPDVIVLDAMLPKRSGFLVLERLKANKKRGDRPYIIMITGNQGKRHQTWAESLGVDGYLAKPFRMDRLLESIEKAIAN